MSFAVTAIEGHDGHDAGNQHMVNGSRGVVIGGGGSTIPALVAGAAKAAVAACVTVVATGVKAGAAVTAKTAKAPTPASWTIYVVLPLLTESEIGTLTRKAAAAATARLAATAVRARPAAA
jgi:hypothetical protein